MYMQLEFKPKLKLGLDSSKINIFYKTMFLFLSNKKERKKIFSEQATARGSGHTNLDSLLTQQNTVFSNIISFITNKTNNRAILFLGKPDQNSKTNYFNFTYNGGKVLPNLTKFALCYSR